jgi:trans-2,3-dihydro-3-hydroxyanthranilate isomerase
LNADQPAGLRLSWVDVFTDRPFAGNPLAVVHDADELSGEQMLTLASELGLSETVFVLDDARVLRIFTPEREIPLAGHPVVGAAVELARLGRVPSEGNVTFRTGAGYTPVELGSGRATMTQAKPERGPELDAVSVAPLLGIEPSDMTGTPVVWSTAIPFALVQLRERETLARLRPDQARIGALQLVDGVAAWCEEAPRGGGQAAGSGRTELAMRAFLPGLGIPEDPATGAAAGALASLLVFQGAEAGPIVIRQGREIGRPSTITVEARGVPGRPEAPRVGGSAVLVFEATLARAAFSPGRKNR